MTAEISASVPEPEAGRKNAGTVDKISEDSLDKNPEESQETAVLVDSKATAEAEITVDSETQAVRDEGKKTERQKANVNSSLEDLYRLLETKYFSRDEISASLGQMAENYGQSNEKWMELTTFLENANSLFAENFPQEKKLEIICALAEVVVEDNGIDGETIGMLSGNIEYYSDPEAMNKDVNLLESGDVAAAWTADAEGNRHLIVFDKLFECEQKEIRHIIKHELSHPLDKYGEIYSKEQKQQIRDHFEGKKVDLDGVIQGVVAIIESAKENKATQSERVYKFLMAIEKLEENGEQDPTYIKAKAAAGEKGLPFEVYLAMVKADAAEEIMAEQSAAYLESDGSYVDFVCASLENRSPELYKFLEIKTDDDKKRLDSAINQLASAKTPEDKDAVLNDMKVKWPKIYDFMREKHVFYKNINDKVVKPDFKETIKANIETRAGEEDEYFDGVTGDSNPSKEGASGGEQKRGESLLSIAKEMADAFGGEIEKVIPGVKQGG